MDGFEDRLRQRTQSMNHALDTIPANKVHNPRGRIPNTPLAASTISFVLGSLFALGVLTFVVGGFDGVWCATYQLGFYLAAWAAFHWGEFAVTAGWNKDKCSVDSFLLENGAQYHIAHGAAVVEFVTTLYFKPSLKQFPYISLIGVVLAILGQALRSFAMIQAGISFSHSVAHQKLDTHVLVTDGIYSWFRHPSYAGFFYWAVGTQLVLQNPVSLVAFVIVLWRFFNSRIRSEEGLLIRFFGNDYVQYRKRVRTMIPLIP